jgi:hypothetical protein
MSDPLDALNGRGAGPILPPEGPTPVLRCLADVDPENVRFLWPGRIPFGKITLFDGDPGLGKSLATLDIAARLTTGTAFACETERPDAAAAIFLCAEDGLAVNSQDVVLR